MQPDSRRQKGKGYKNYLSANILAGMVGDGRGYNQAGARPCRALTPMVELFLFEGI